MSGVVTVGLDGAGESREFLDGSLRSAAQLPSIRIGRGVYRPGWRWSLHAGPQTGQPAAAHIGYVEAGRMAVRAADGREVTVGPGEAFEVGPGRDAWVVGDEPCIALEFGPIAP
jgi:quercetin dioxygenase-like cupin family protein